MVINLPELIAGIQIPCDANALFWEVGHDLINDLRGSGDFFDRRPDERKARVNFQGS